MIAIGQFLFRFRNAIFPLVMLCTLLFARPYYSLGSEAMDWLLDLVGIAMIAAGQALRVLTIGYQYIRRGGRDGRVYAKGLVQGGVFAHCRNPLYVGNILLAVGFLLVIGQWWLIAAGVPLVIFVYIAIVAAEEDYLSREFGDQYAAYQKRVNRWLPNWKGFRESVAPMDFNWQRVLAKEYNTFFAVLAGLLFIEAYTRSLEGGISQGGWALVIAIGSLLAVGFLAIRLLKKKGVIRGWLPGE